MTDIERRTVIKTALAAGAAATIPAAASASDKPLAGKSILITGASSGFGYLGALHYARLGAKVIASMRGLPRKEADELKAEAAKEKLDIQIIQIDVTSDEQVADDVCRQQQKKNPRKTENRRWRHQFRQDRDSVSDVYPRALEEPGRQAGDEKIGAQRGKERRHADSEHNKAFEQAHPGGCHQGDSGAGQFRPALVGAQQPEDGGREAGGRAG